jgi:hypothetical protein
LSHVAPFDLPVEEFSSSSHRMRFNSILALASLPDRVTFSCFFEFSISLIPFP